MDSPSLVVPPAERRCDVRLLAVDIDGTLVDSQGRLPPANREALHRAHAAGLKVCLCTGRSYTESREVIEQLGLDLDAGVFVFGATVWDLLRRRALHRTPLPEPLADELIRFFGRRDYPILVLYDVSEAGTDYVLLSGGRNIEAYRQWMRISPCRILESDRLLAGHQPLRLGVIEEQADAMELYRELQEAFPPERLKANHIYAPNYDLHVVECFAPQVNKWHGLRQLMTAWGIAPREVAAIGDDINDLEMISQAGLGIAMGNARDSIRRVARLSVPTNDQAGVAHAVEILLDHRRSASGP